MQKTLWFLQTYQSCRRVRGAGHRNGVEDALPPIGDPIRKLEALGVHPTGREPNWSQKGALLQLRPLRNTPPATFPKPNICQCTAFALQNLAQAIQAQNQTPALSYIPVQEQKPVSGTLPITFTNQDLSVYTTGNVQNHTAKRHCRDCDTSPEPSTECDPDSAPLSIRQVLFQCQN